MINGQVIFPLQTVISHNFPGKPILSLQKIDTKSMYIQVHSVVFNLRFRSFKSITLEVLLL